MFLSLSRWSGVFDLCAMIVWRWRRPYGVAHEKSFMGHPYALTLSPICRVVSLGTGGSHCWDRGGGVWKGTGSVALITEKVMLAFAPPTFLFRLCCCPLALPHPLSISFGVDWARRRSLLVRLHVNVGDIGTCADIPGTCRPGGVAKGSSPRIEHPLGIP